MSDERTEPEVLAEGRFLRLVRRRGWEYAERRHVTGIVILVAVTPDDELLLVEQHREAVGSTVIELPAGLAGDEPGHESESLEQAATRELLEETGWEAQSWERLSAGPPTSGVSNEVVTLMRARDLRHHNGKAAEEGITVHTVPLAKLSSWLREREGAGTLVDPKVWAGLWFATH
ncbi:MAG TPA: NUDIX hydrolase [Thermoanaerobaculia bacterium]|jgi:ADP-ribose pyrophosphatase|nr:NUDIX hydrolase [Thermoanaerobaculia bacterium]